MSVVLSSPAVAQGTKAVLSARIVRGTGALVADAEVFVVQLDRTVPTSASVSLDFRLVPNQKPARIRQLLEAHLTSLGYTITRDANAAAKSADRSRLALVVWDDGYTSVRVASTLAPVQAVKRLLTNAYGHEPFIMPILGGSLPLFHFVEQLGATVITVPTVNADNSQHAPNENLRVRNLWDGIAVMAELMTGLGKEWPGVLR